VGTACAVRAGWPLAAPACWTTGSSCTWAATRRPRSTVRTRLAATAATRALACRRGWPLKQNTPDSRQRSGVLSMAGSRGLLSPGTLPGGAACASPAPAARWPAGPACRGWPPAAAVVGRTACAGLLHGRRYGIVLRTEAMAIEAQSHL